MLRYLDCQFQHRHSTLVSAAPATRSCVSFFFFKGSGPPRDLPSSPTRRSPDPRGGEPLAEPRHGLARVDDPPRLGPDHVDDEEADRVAADIDRAEAHADRRTPRRIAAEIGRAHV